MGTNYYLMYPEKRCDHCGQLTMHERSREHIGKSSAGWHFGFNATTYKTTDAWKKAIDECIAGGGWICDEYNADGKVSPELFWSMVRGKRDAPCCMTNPDKVGPWYRRDDVRCVDGVDFCNYTFS